MKKFSYTRESNPAIFNALKNVDIYSITLKEEVYKMNHDGKIIDAYAIIRGLKNYQYKTADGLNGICPYMTSNDALSTELVKLMEKKDMELAEATPCLEKIEYIQKMIHDES